MVRSLGLPRPTIRAAVATIWSKNVPNWPEALPYGKYVHGSKGMVPGQFRTVQMVCR